MMKLVITKEILFTKEFLKIHYLNFILSFLVQSQFSTQDGSSSFFLLICSLAHRKRFSFTLIPLVLQQCKYNQTRTRTVILNVGHCQNSISKTAFQTLQSSLSCNVQLHFFSDSNKFVTGLYRISEVWTHDVKGRTQILLFHSSLQNIHMHIRTHCSETSGLHLLPPWLNCHLEKCNVICILYLF